MKHFFEFIGHGKTSLPAVIWQPEHEVKAVLQITHGMTEQVALHLYPDARHDIFHEEANGTAESVHHCITDWLLS